jgi:predicted metal-binding protein
MEIQFEKIEQVCSTLKADHTALIDVEQFVFSKALRDMCTSNVCGKYGSNWACPPAIGEFEEAQQKLKTYDKALIIQTVYTLEDSFDFEGMLEAKKVHKEVVEKIDAAIGEMYPELDKMSLGAGGCEYCEKCTYTENKPCRFPKKLVAPIEGHGVDVTALAKTSGMAYNNGPNTVSYIGAILLK